MGMREPKSHTKPKTFRIANETETQNNWHAKKQDQQKKRKKKKSRQETKAKNVKIVHFRIHD